MFSSFFWFLTAALFALGTAIGSFINVLIYRSIEGESWVKGRSHCEHCHKKIAWFDNIPLLSFLVLQGQCRHCHKPIAISHPVIEFLTGTLFVWWYWGGFFFFKLSHQPFQYIQPLFWLIVGVVLLVIFFVDLRYYVIPDEAVFLLLALVFLYRISLTVTGIMRLEDFVLTVLATIVATAFFYFLWWVTKQKGMGFGDVKFMLPYGLLLGWPNVLVGLFLAFVIGAVVSIGLMLLGKKTIKQTVPFGPFLVLSTFLTLLWGNDILHWYLSLLLR